MSTTTTFKLASAYGTAKRFSITYSTPEALFESLKKSLQDRKVPFEGLQWIDDEGDYVELQTVADLQEAISVSPGAIHLVNGQEEQEEEEEFPEDQEDQEVVLIDSDGESVTSDTSEDRPRARKDRARTRSRSRGRARTRSRSRGHSRSRSRNHRRRRAHSEGCKDRRMRCAMKKMMRHRRQRCAMERMRRGHGPFGPHCRHPDMPHHFPAFGSWDHPRHHMPPMGPWGHGPWGHKDHPGHHMPPMGPWGHGPWGHKDHPGHHMPPMGPWGHGPWDEEYPGCHPGFAKRFWRHKGPFGRRHRHHMRSFWGPRHFGAEEDCHAPPPPPFEEEELEQGRPPFGSFRRGPSGRGRRCGRRASFRAPENYEQEEGEIEGDNQGLPPPPPFEGHFGGDYDTAPRRPFWNFGRRGRDLFAGRGFFGGRGRFC